MRTEDGQARFADVIRFLCSRYKCHAFLHYGSTSVEGEIESEGQDVDVLILGSRDEDHRLFEVSGMFVDVAFVTIQEARQRLMTQYEHNNNYMLNALTSGNVWLDGDGELSRLIVEAHQLFLAGPASLSVEIIGQKRRAAALSLQAAYRLMLRSHTDEDCLRLAFLRLDQLFVNLFLTYWSIRRRWASGFRQMLVIARERKLATYGIWLEYSAALHIGQKFVAVNILVDMVFDLA